LVNTNKQKDKYSEHAFKYLRKILFKIVFEHNKNIQILLIEYVYSNTLRITRRPNTRTSKKSMD